MHNPALQGTLRDKAVPQPCGSTLATSNKEHQVIRSLRKGRTSVYLKHPHTGHSIGAEEYESKIEAEVAVLCFTLRPVDRNQKSDEEYLHNDVLEYVDINDATVITSLENHVKSHSQEVTSWKLQIISLGKIFRFEVSPSFLQHGTLHLCVLSASG